MFCFNLFNFTLLVQLLLPFSNSIIAIAQNVKDVPYLVLFARKNWNPNGNTAESTKVSTGSMYYGTGILVSPYDVLTTSTWLLTLDSASASSYFEAYAAADSLQLTPDKGHAIRNMTVYPGLEHENHVLLSPLNAAMIRLEDKFKPSNSEPIMVSKTHSKYYEPGAKVQTYSFKKLDNRVVLRSVNYTIIDSVRCKDLITTKYYSTGTGYLTRAQVCAEADHEVQDLFDHSYVGGAVLGGHPPRLVGVLLMGGTHVFESNNLVVFLRMDYIYDFVDKHMSQFPRCPSPHMVDYAKTQISYSKKMVDYNNQAKSKWQSWINKFDESCSKD